MDVVLDTNAIMYAVKYKVDLTVALSSLDFVKNEVIVPRSVIKELERLKKKGAKGSIKDNANLALQIIKAKEFKVKRLGDGHTDTVILDYAVKKPAAVVTNDAALRRKLKKAGVTTLAVRQKSYLA